MDQPPYPQITLRKGREAAVARRNPWVFSGAVQHEPSDLADGDLVTVTASDGSILGHGHFQAGSIRVRLLHFGAGSLPEDHLTRLLASAWARRGLLGLTEDPLTNAYRLVHAAGDGLPGLVVDRYASVAVVQCHSIGMHRQRQEIARFLLTLPGIDSVYDKSSAVLPDRYGANRTDGTVAGEVLDEVIVVENGRRFRIDLANGQKTGFFLDQRENRWLLGSYARGKRVLNLFCYTGGFSVYALQGGGAQVQSVDLSGPAAALAEENAARNGETGGVHRTATADVMDWLKEHAGEQPYDIVVVDPPAYAKNKHRRHKAVQAYKRLNVRAMEHLQPGGLLFTFSCSRVVERQLFYDTIVAAGLESGRSVRVLHHLRQGPDHPVSLFHPEGEYLKGLVVQVD